MHMESFFMMIVNLVPPNIWRNTNHENGSHPLSVITTTLRARVTQGKWVCIFPTGYTFKKKIWTIHLTLTPQLANRGGQISVLFSTDVSLHTQTNFWFRSRNIHNIHLIHSLFQYFWCVFDLCGMKIICHDFLQKYFPHNFQNISNHEIIQVNQG